MTKQKAILRLEDETQIIADRFGADCNTAGEVVFNTGMVGYPESLTDPSYKGQILVLTYPLIGNYGVPGLTYDKFGLPLGFESEKIQISGLIVSEYSVTYSHHTAVRSLDQWLKDENIPALYNVDTRALTKKIRDKGSLLGCFENSAGQMKFYNPNTADLAAQVTVSEVIKYDCGFENAPTIVVVDCGAKVSIIRSLLLRKVNVIRVPYDYYFLNIDYDGLLISNGPGDPKMYDVITQNVERALAVGKPIFGICLGHQILARAVGAETYKLKFGHRSHNQPCILTNGHDNTARCYITSQNHGYVVREESLPSDWEVLFKNANDQTVEGIRHHSKPFSSVQFHPEATPGPVDTTWLFDEFCVKVRQCEARIV